MVMGSARDGGVADIRPVAPEGAGRPHMFDAGDQRLIHAIVLLMIVERSAEVQPLLLQAMAARASGLILFDADGCPVFIDDGARAFFAARDGLCLNGTGFVTGRGPETRRLQLMIARGLTGSTQITPPVRRMQMLVTRSSLCRPYLVRVLTIAQPRGHAPGSIACAVHIHDLAAIHVPDRLLLREIFGLTRREVDLAIELVRAGGLAPAAAATGTAAAIARGDDTPAADRQAKPWPAALAKVDTQLRTIEAGVERMRAAKTDAERDAIAAGVEAEQKRYAAALYGQYSAALRTTSGFASSKGKAGSLEPLRVFEELAQAHERRLKAVETKAKALRGGAIGFVPTPIDRSQQDVMSRVAGFFIPSANAAIALSVYNVCNRKPFNAAACATATAQGVSQGNAAYATYNSCWAKQEGVRPKWWRATLRAACATALGVRLA